MPESNPSKDEFLYPHYPYHGEPIPKKIVFNANLQEFAQKVNYICNLETGGKISSEEAYHQIKELWKELKSSRKGLELDQPEDNEG